MIYKLFFSWEPKNIPTRSENSSITILWGHFVNVENIWTTHTYGCPTRTALPNLQTHLTTPGFLPALQPSSFFTCSYRSSCSVLFSECIWAADDSSSKTVNILRNRPVTETLAVYQWFSKMIVHAVPKQHVHTYFKKISNNIC